MTTILLILMLFRLVVVVSNNIKATLIGSIYIIIYNSMFLAAFKVTMSTENVTLDNFTEDDYIYEVAVDSDSDEISPTSPNELFDITLLIGEDKLYTSRMILSCASPVWRRLFTSDFKEKSTSEIPLPGKKYSAVLELLLCITPGFRKFVTCKA